MITLLLGSFWLTLGAYTMWYLFKAKSFQALTLDNLALTWKLHKQRSNCKGSNIQSLLTKHGEVVGYQCECGHKFLQERLVSQKVHHHVTNRTPSIFQLATLFQKTGSSFQNKDFSKICIKEIQKQPTLPP